MIMKRFLLTILCSLFMFVSYAQSSQIAVLSHNGTASVFYGATALRDAYSAAANGDAITLSSGSFMSVDIAKAITLRGAGMELDTVQNIEPTIITGDFYIAIPDTVSQRLVIEGVHSNDEITYKGLLNNPVFIKCRFKDFETPAGAGNDCLYNANFIHCKIVGSLYTVAAGDYYTASSASFINCVVADARGWNFYFENCVLKYNDYEFNFSKNNYYKNSIIEGGFKSRILPSEAFSYNCVGINDVNLFENITNSTNTMSTAAEVFKTYDGGDIQQLDSENFELTDAAKAKFLGTDGKEVGIYGGTFPFSSTPTNPQITKCNVASKSTIDGKLSVDIEVKVVE